MRVKLYANLVFASALFFLMSGAAWSDVKINVTYTEIQHEISPNNSVHRVQRKRELILKNDHKVRDSFDFGYGGKSSTGISKLGKMGKGKIFSGEDNAYKYSIENGAIVCRSSIASYMTTLKIKTNGTDSCNAEIRFDLRKGYKLFEDKRMSNHEDLKMDDIHAEDLTCVIGAINN